MWMGRWAVDQDDEVIVTLPKNGQTLTHNMCPRRRSPRQRTQAMCRRPPPSVLREAEMEKNFDGALRTRKRDVLHLLVYVWHTGSSVMA